MSIQGTKFLDHYIKERELGAGAFGTVFAARHVLDKRVYAVKWIRLNDRSGSDPLGEVEKLANFKHGNIVEYKFSFLEDAAVSRLATAGAAVAADEPAPAVPGQEVERVRSAPVSVNDGNTCASPMSVHDGRSAIGAASSGHPAPMEVDDRLVAGENQQQQRLLYIVMEFCHCSLEDYLRTNGILNSDAVWDIMRQLVHALLYLKDKKVVHGDIKPGNILLVEDEKKDVFPYVVKLGDFGLTAVYGSLLRAGTPLYWSPEQEATHISSSCSPKSDVYSLGLVLLQLLCLPPSLEETAALFSKARAGDFGSVSSCEKQLLAGMLQKDPSQRKDVMDVLKHVDSFHSVRKRHSISVTAPL